MRWVLCLCIVCRLIGQGEAEELMLPLVPSTVSTGTFRLEQGQLIWIMSGPDASVGAFAREFWQQQHRNIAIWPHLAGVLRSLTWTFDSFPEHLLRFDMIDITTHTMRCVSDVPLAPSAKAMLDALGCQWDIS